MTKASYLNLVAESEAAATAEQFPSTPHRRLADALRRLGETGQESAASVVEKLVASALKYPLPDGRPNPVFVVLAFKDLLGVQTEFPASYRHARAAAEELFDLGFPEIEPKGAA